MIRYTKRDDDLKYRMVNTASAHEDKEFQDFFGQTVSYHEDCVLEILRSDGTVHIEYGAPRKTVTIATDGNCLYFPAKIPRHRMWVRDAGGMYYKIPTILPERDGHVYVLIPAGPGTVEVCGDPYFEAVYELIKT